MDNQQENEKPEEESLDFNRPDFTFIPKGIHEWVQRGPYLICKSCELEHAVWVGMQAQMIGIKEDGQPILRLRSE